MNVNQERIPVIIPSYEPDARLVSLLEKLVDAGIKNIVIVDDGSGEDYKEYFETAKNKFHAQVIVHDKNSGKGAALKTAFRFCIENIPDLIGCITADSDGQHSPECILKVMESLEKNPSEFIMGSRDFTQPGVPKMSAFGNRNTNKIIKTVYKKDLKDTQTGLRGLPKAFMSDCLGIKGDRFEFEIKMLCLALEKEIGIEEVPIKTIYDSEKNHATHFNPFLDTVKIYRSLGFFKSIGIILFGKK